MGTVLSFPQRQSTVRRNDHNPPGSAEILLFNGVRYEHWLRPTPERAGALPCPYPGAPGPARRN